MKQKIKTILIIAFVAIIGFTMTACDLNGKTVRSKFLFSGNPNTANRSVLNNSAARSVEGGIDGAEEFEEFYTKIGAYKESITPTTLELPVANLSIFRMEKGNAIEEILIPRGGGSGGNLATAAIDLTNPIVINLDEVETGRYPYVRFRFSMTALGGGSGGQAVTSKISFPKPEDLDYDSHVYNTEPYYSNISLEGNNITGELQYFQPSSTATLHGIDTSLPLLGTFNVIYMGGNIYKAFNNPLFYGDEDTQGFIHAKDYLPGIEDLRPSYYHRLNTPNEFNLLIPFSGINVPDNANAVRFEIYWDIDGIIERYEGGTDSPDDDIFILKNKFWEDFSIRAVIE